MAMGLGDAWFFIGETLKVHMDGLYMGLNSLLNSLNMTKAKTGVFLSMGRLPQIVGQAALAASVFAGGASLLNAGGAMAAPGDCATAGVANLNSTSPPITDFIATCPLLPGGDELTSAVDYDPAALITGSGSYNFKYDVTPAGVSKGGPWFKFVDLGVDVNGIGTYSVSVTKSVYDSNAMTNLLGSITFTQTQSGASKTPELILPDNTYNHLYIVDSYAVTGVAGIDKITNTFEQVPGPLPILGAGAAFGFSRKLRSRIKAGRTA